MIRPTCHSMTSNAGTPADISQPNRYSQPTRTPIQQLRHRGQAHGTLWRNPPAFLTHSMRGHRLSISSSASCSPVFLHTEHTGAASCRMDHGIGQRVQPGAGSVNSRPSDAQDRHRHIAGHHHRQHRACVCNSRLARWRSRAIANPPCQRHDSCLSACCSPWQDALPFLHRRNPHRCPLPNHL